MKKLYIVYVHITPDGMHYYGVTSQKVERRWKGNGINYKRTSLQPYIEKFGWENIQHKVLFENLSKEDALSIEDSLIISGWEKGNCINKIRSGNISKEEDYNQQYREQNKDKIKQYYEQNKDKIKQYYEQNKDKIRKYRREYKEKNRDKINEYRRQRYQKNRDKILEKNRDKRLEYQRQYRQRKKLEKQLKEVETTPLF